MDTKAPTSPGTDSSTQEILNTILNQKRRLRGTVKLCNFHGELLDLLRKIESPDMDEFGLHAVRGSRLHDHLRSVSLCLEGASDPEAWLNPARRSTQ